MFTGLRTLSVSLRHPSHENDMKTLIWIFLTFEAIFGLSLKGGDFACSQPDGQEIRIPGITDVPTSVKIQCVCEKGVGKCRKVRDECAERLSGCHFYQNSQFGKCSKECKGCGM